jgi:hypothetical protein
LEEEPMLRKLLTLSLALILLGCLWLTAARAATKPEAAARATARLKSEIVKLADQQAGIEFNLTDGTSLVGHVRTWSETEFVVVDAKSGAASTLTYPQVLKVKRHGLNTAEKIGIGVAASMGVLLLIGTYCNHKGCPGW